MFFYRPQMVPQYCKYSKDLPLGDVCQRKASTWSYSLLDLETISKASRLRSTTSCTLAPTLASGRQTMEEEGTETCACGGRLRMWCHMKQCVHQPFKQLTIDGNCCQVQVSRQQSNSVLDFFCADLQLNIVQLADCSSGVSTSRVANPNDEMVCA